MQIKKYIYTMLSPLLCIVFFLSYSDDVVLREEMVANNLELHRTGNVLFGYELIVSVVSQNGNELCREELFDFYDSPNEWKSFISEIQCENNSCSIFMSPSLFAFGRKTYLTNKEKLNCIDATVRLIFPAVEDIKNYEEKFTN